MQRTCLSAAKSHVEKGANPVLLLLIPHNLLIVLIELSICFSNSFNSLEYGFDEYSQISNSSKLSKWKSLKNC